MTPNTILPRLRVPRRRDDWFVDVGRCDQDWETSLVLAEVALPETVDRVVVRLHRDGTWWSVPGEPRKIIVPWTRPAFAWRDGQTRLTPYVIAPLEELGHALKQITSLIGKKALSDRELESVLAIALELEMGAMHRWLIRAARVFERGIDDEEARGWAERGLELRITLERIAMDHGAPLLIDALARVDAALEPAASAVMLVGDETYDRVTGEFPVDEQTWWGAREALRSGVPEEKVAGELMGVRESGARVIPLRAQHPVETARPLWRAAAANDDLATRITALGSCEKGSLRWQFDAVMESLNRVPCLWLRADVKEAVDSLAGQSVLGWRLEALHEAVLPVAGRVPLLLYLHERHAGVLLELRISRGGDGLWARAGALRPIARDAIRLAFAAVAASTDTMQPRFPIDEHVIDVVGPESVLQELAAIDGTSITLPAALAFASLWLGQAPPWDSASTGGLRLHRDRVEVLRVGSSGLEAKARALAAWARPERAKLIVADGHRLEESVALMGVGTLNEALEAVGLDLAGRSRWMPLGDQATRMAELDRLFHELRTQDLTRHRREGAIPWCVLGDRIQTIATSLRNVVAADDPRLAHAEAYAALAHAHAGDMSVLARVPEIAASNDLPPAVAVVGLLASLVHAIGGESYDACDALRRALDERLGALHDSERRSLFGVVRGTQGRSFLHDRRLPREERARKSIPLLETSVEHHARHNPVEAPRSRIYLSMALRTAGRTDAAWIQLLHAQRELESDTRVWSGTYYQTTRVYLLYERARVALELGRHEQALADTELALSHTDDQTFWPAIGILRTRTWALRAAGQTAEADESARLMRQRAQGVPEAVRKLIDRMVAEAEGPMTRDGEVY